MYEKGSVIKLMHILPIFHLQFTSLLNDNNHMKMVIQFFLHFTFIFPIIFLMITIAIILPDIF